MKDIPNILQKLDELKKNKNQIKYTFSRIKVNTLNCFISKNPKKIKLIIPVERYDDDKMVSGIYPFGSTKKEILKTKNSKDELLYHLMDVGGYSSVPQDSKSIQIIEVDYTHIKEIFKKENIYNDLLKRYEVVIGKQDKIKVLIHNINETVLYIKNRYMQQLFPESYLDEEKKYIYLFHNTELDDRFKLSYRTSGNSLFPKNEGESQLYSNIYPGRFGNNSINMNNVKEISNKGQKKVKSLLQCIKKKKTKKNKKSNQKTKKNLL